MAVSEKAKEKLDEAGREIKDAIDSLRNEVSELSAKIKEKLKGAGEEMQESADELTHEVKKLTEKVKDLIPKRKKKSQLPVHIERTADYPGDLWERPFMELRKATDRLFEDFFRDYRSPLSGWRSPWGLSTNISGIDWPRADMDETDDEIRITVELPGVDRDNIDISMTDDRITIRGEKKEEEEEKGKGFYTLERAYGSFQRSFYLPCEVESDDIDASFKKGVLTLKLPKSADAKEQIKKIPVRTG